MTRIKRSKLIRIVLAIAILIAIFVGIGSHTHKWYIIFGPSMSPTINSWTLAFVDTNAKFKEGDVVVFENNGTTYIKRVDSIGHGEYDFDGASKYAFVDEEINFKNAELKSKLDIQNVKSDEVIVFGDNQKASIDSRDFGPIKISSIYGKVISTLSLDRGYVTNLINKTPLDIHSEEMQAYKQKMIQALKQKNQSEGR